MLSLRWRLTLIYTGVLALTLLLFSLTLYAVLQRNLLRETDRTLALRAAELAYRPQTPRGPAWRRMLLPPHFSVFANPDVYLQVVDKAGEVIEKSPNLGTETLPVTPDVVARAVQEGAFFQTVPANGERLRVYNLPLAAGGAAAVLQVGRSLEPVYGVLDRLVRLLLLVGLTVVALATSAGYYLARAALTPVDHLTRVAAAIGETQDLERRVAYQGPPDEIGRLAATFNGMLARLAAQQRSLEEAYAAQRRFVADVSHELRTPLTIIRGNLELLQQMEGRGSAAAEILADAAEEAERMSRLLHNLLILARADAGQHIEKAPLDLEPLVQEVARQAPLLGPTPFHTHGLDALADGRIMGNADYLKQLLLILLDNAFKYTPPEGTITLSAAREDGWYRIGVADTGPGIPPEELPRIFNRFFRGAAGRAGGTGLGLAIARWIAEEHGGRLEVTSTPGRGTTFTLRLPALETENIS
ncbi:MAG: HAMP domain-containing sensor histidine kinase [Bacillota bacterium]